jgi:hypothetical protein
MNYQMHFVGVAEIVSFEIPVDGARPVVLDEDGNMKLGEKGKRGDEVKDLIVSFYYEFESEKLQRESQEVVKIKSLIEVINQIELLVGDGILAIKRLPTTSRYVSGPIDYDKNISVFVTYVDLIVAACTSGIDAH